MTYKEIFIEFLNKVKNSTEIEDYRPCFKTYGVPDIQYAIVVWFKDGSKIIYISDNAKKADCRGTII